MNKFQILAITVAALLMAPLAMSWASYLAPVLALAGVCVAGGVVVHWALNAVQSDNTPVKVANGTVPAMVMPQMSSGRTPALGHPTHDVFPLDALPKKHNALLRLWGWLWNHPNHAAVMLGSAAWIICPLDGDMIIVAGWIDDLGALLLFCKHANDLYQSKWGKPPAQMIASKGAELIDHARDQVRSAPAQPREAVPAKWRR